MRGLELWDADPVFVDAEVFEAIEALAVTCKFRNCGHDSEPNCAVREAVARGEIDPAALERYRAAE